MPLKMERSSGARGFAKEMSSGEAQQRYDTLVISVYNAMLEYMSATGANPADVVEDVMDAAVGAAAGVKGLKQAMVAAGYADRITPNAQQDFGENEASTIVRVVAWSRRFLQRHNPRETVEALIAKLGLEGAAKVAMELRPPEAKLPKFLQDLMAGGKGLVISENASRGDALEFLDKVDGAVGFIINQRTGKIEANFDNAGEDCQNPDCPVHGNMNKLKEQVAAHNAAIDSGAVGAAAATQRAQTLIASFGMLGKPDDPLKIN